MGSREYRFINLFRALAAFWVLAAHCATWSGHVVPLRLQPEMAVNLFMLVSGFVMCAATSAPLDVPRNRAAFWTRRFFRIAPVYYLALAISVVAAPWLVTGYGALGGGVQAHRLLSGVDYSLQSILMHASFLFGMSPSYSASTLLPDWSLSLEMQFYAVFPALMLFMGRRGIEAPFVVALFSILIARGIDSYAGFEYPSLLLFKLNYFAAGMLAHRAITQGSGRAAIYALLICLVSPGWRTMESLMLAMLLIGRLETTGKLVKVDNCVVRFMSDVSYSVYLFHGFFIATFGLLIADRIPASLALPALLSFVTLSAYATGFLVHRSVELPGIAVGRVIVRKMRKPQSDQMLARPA